MSLRRQLVNPGSSKTSRIANNERLWNYWREQLSGELTLLNLPTDRPQTATPTYREASHTFQLAEELTYSIKALADQQNASLFTTLLAALKTLLYRLSGQEDILVVSPLKQEIQRELEGEVNYCVNPVVLRSNLSGNPTFAEFLNRIRQTVWGAGEHQDYPFRLLVEKLQQERDRSSSSLFQVMFVLQQPEQRKASSSIVPTEMGSHITLEEYPLASEVIEQFEFTLKIIEGSSNLEASIEYNQELFDEATIARIAGHFQTLLEGIVANPEQRVAHLPLLTEAEQHQLLVEWNNTQTEYSQQRCIHQWIETQVEQTPDAVALVFEDEQITYRQLNGRANKIAHYLQSLGVGPEVLVGICVERSIEMIEGVLGILKAGGAYVPLDPAYPQERLAYMLEDSQVQVLLTQQRLVERLPASAATVVCLDSDWETVDCCSQENPAHRVTPDNLAYVIYTSGSTGKPKGVLVNHQGLCNLAKAQIQIFDVQPNSCVLQFASFSFDASVSEIFTALGSGARLAIATAESLQPGPDLIGLLQKQGITHVTLPPSALAALPEVELPTLQTLIVAGELCPPELVKKWSKGRRFLNGYGPTESTVCATVGEWSDREEKLTIGRPIPNMQVYILDPHLQPVPIGVPGELHVSGVGLARGYLNRPDLTEQKFIPNPFTKTTVNSKKAKEIEEDASGLPASDRLYKTGDLVRYLPDGNIEFLGRIDNLVKIRGFRIELREIESVLLQHPSVREATVISREDSPSNKRLVAYVVGNEEPPSITELGNFLKKMLPDYMVPSAFVVLEAMPLTPNGKVDRKALPAPSGKRPELETVYVEPETETEKLIATVWQETLGIDKVGIHDNFFDLGGNSLLVAQVHSQLSERLGQQLSRIELFQYPTIQTLANYLSSNLNPQLGSQVSQKRAKARQAVSTRREQQQQSRQKFRQSPQTNKQLHADTLDRTAESLGYERATTDNNREEGEI